MFRKAKGANGDDISAAGLKTPQETRGKQKTWKESLTVAVLSTLPTYRIIQTAN